MKDGSSGSGFKTAFKSREDDSTYFDCNPGNKGTLDESLAFDSKRAKVETFDANAMQPIDKQLL